MELMNYPQRGLARPVSRFKLICLKHINDYTIQARIQLFGKIITNASEHVLILSRFHTESKQTHCTTIYNDA